MRILGSRILLYPLLLASCCFLAGCAAEAPPHAPRIQLPERISDLKVRQVGRTLRLQFTRPVLAEDKRRLTKPLEVRIYRDVTPAGVRPPRLFVASKPWASLPARTLSQHSRGGAVIYEDRLSAQTYSRLLGSTLTFMVTSLTRSFGGHVRVSDPSNPVRIEVLDVSPPIQTLHVRQQPDGVDLGWSRPTRSLTGRSIPRVAGYLIYRTPIPASGASPIQTTLTRYLDSDFHFNRTYLYQISAVFKLGGTQAESEPSLPVEITPRDIFPPPVPTGLMAVYTGRSVELVWKPDRGTKFGGYNLYRRQGHQPAKRLNPQLLLTPVFSDRTARHGRSYVYWVTAVSRTGHESGPSGSVIESLGE
jgi:hypothetical protein